MLLPCPFCNSAEGVTSAIDYQPNGFRKYSGQRAVAGKPVAWRWRMVAAIRALATLEQL